MNSRPSSRDSQRDRNSTVRSQNNLDSPTLVRSQTNHAEPNRGNRESTALKKRQKMPRTTSAPLRPLQVGESSVISPTHPSPFLLGVEDPNPVSSHGQGAVFSMMRSHSGLALAQSGSGMGGNMSRRVHSYSGISDEETGLLQQSWDSAQFSAAAGGPPPSSLYGPHMRSMRLIGNSNPRYRWARYWKTDEQLKAMKPRLRAYYERTNFLVQQYLYIDRLLDSSLPHDLLNEYSELHGQGGIFNNGPSEHRSVDIPETIVEDSSSVTPASSHARLPDYGATTLHESPNSLATTAVESNSSSGAASALPAKKIKRTPKDIYRPSEITPLFHHNAHVSDDDDDDNNDNVHHEVPTLEEEDEEIDSSNRIVLWAIYLNFAANAFLLAGKIAVTMTTSSMSVLASLVDALLDFLSTTIVWITTWLISRQDNMLYPVGRRRLEPLGVLVFSVIMVTSFAQVALECIQKLASREHELVQLGLPAMVIMASTILVKGIAWLWCRLINNSSVQALAEDAMTDIIFNTGSIIFPIVGWYARIWWLDSLGGLLLSFVVMYNWSRTSSQHIKNLSGFSATADQRNVLLYLTMRFARSIRRIQNLQAYHAGDKLNVEVDIVLDANMTLRDSHDLAESLGYVLESVPIVDRAFVHCDYASRNLPTHMEQQHVTA